MDQMEVAEVKTTRVVGEDRSGEKTDRERNDEHAMLKVEEERAGTEWAKGIEDRAMEVDSERWKKWRRFLGRNGQRI